MDLLDLERGRERGAAGPTPFMAFDRWGDEDLRALARMGRKVRLGAGEVLLRTGDADDRALYIVAEGELEALRETGEPAPPGEGGGRHRRLNLLAPGDLFGEIAFVDGRRRSADVRALSEASLLRIRPEELDALAERDPALALRFALELARILAARIREADV